MYFPYLRGKQYELLAVKELAALLGSQGVVVPIIEPVRPPTGSGLHRCLAALGAEGNDFILITNPQAGNLRGPTVAPDIVNYVNDTDTDQSWNIGLLVDEGTGITELISEFRASYGLSRRLTLIHTGLSEQLASLVEETQDLRCEFNVVDSRLRRQYFRNLLAVSSGVTLRDGFPSEARNAAYLDREETMFNDDHLFFAEEGWYGFSDYLTIGEQYSDSGFTPRAVVIHWTYEPQEGGPIMIRHFTSESNDDISNIGGKFLEAASKLVVFLDAQNIRTQAADVFRAHVENGTYPGLGIVKKLSIQNHLELMSRILSR